MDNSLSKALIMVASVLLAMLVIAFLTFSFGRIGTWATSEDDSEITEQKDKFNKEYEAYAKDLMYGVDVISCLNKTKSNNDKINNQYGENVDSSYEVKVKVILKKNKPLGESITVYHINDQKKEVAYTQDNGPTQKKTLLNNMKKEFNFLEKDYAYISNFGGNTKLVTQIENCTQLENVNELNLTATGTGQNEEKTRQLLSLSDTISEIIKNTDSKTNAIENGWTKAEFKSALYDLKIRKFKCTSLNYSESGRVNSIEFTEI